MIGRPRLEAMLAGALATLLLMAAPATSQSGPRAGGPSRNAERHLDAPYVVMISFDGFRWDYQDRYPSPAFDRVAEAGARAERMIPVFPSKTFPAHYTLATGMYAESHGLVGNAFWDAEKDAGYEVGDRATVEDGDWYRGEPIWVTAERQGMVAASYFFVGSEADVGGVRPSYWHRYDGRVPNAARVDAVLEWLSLPARERPHMITMYFSDVDDAGHDHGPDSDQVADAVAAVDAQLGRLLDGIEALPHAADVYVVLVSDHGMLAAPAADAEVVDLDLFPGIRLITGGPFANIYIEQGGAERAPALRDSIAALMVESPVYLRADVPHRLRYRADPRVGDLVIVGAPGRTVGARRPRRDSFTHGWDNQLPEMGAIFLIAGPRIRAGARIEPFESVHVYPLLAELLGLTPSPTADGRLEVLRGILVN